MKKNIMIIGIILALLLVIIAIVFAIEYKKEIDTNTDNTNLTNIGTNTKNNNSNVEIETQEEQSNEVVKEEMNIYNEERKGKTLVVYYSRSGNTDKIAKYIQNKVDGDIIRLETNKTYPSNYDQMLDVAQEEQRNGELPSLKTVVDNIEEYDTIFLGYPIWWGDIATPVLTFLDMYDLSNKTIIPFVTSGSSGLSGTPNVIKRLEPQAQVLEAISITSSSLNNYENLTDNGLEKLGF